MYLRVMLKNRKKESYSNYCKIDVSFFHEFDKYMKRYLAGNYLEVWIEQKDGKKTLLGRGKDPCPLKEKTFRNLRYYYPGFFQHKMILFFQYMADEIAFWNHRGWLFMRRFVRRKEKKWLGFSYFFQHKLRKYAMLDWLISLTPESY